jgi:ribonuclease Z
MLSAQIVGTSAEANVAPSILISSDKFRLLFNAGEGTDRLTKEYGHTHGIRLAKLTHFFMSELNWNCWGGLPDIVFYLADLDAPNSELHIYGPENTIDYTLAARYYLWQPHFALKIREITHDLEAVEISGSSETLRVVPIIISKAGLNQNNERNEKYMINTSFLNCMDMYRDSLAIEREQVTPEQIDVFVEKAESALELLNNMEHTSDVFDKPIDFVNHETAIEKAIMKEGANIIKSLDIFQNFDRPAFIRKPITPQGHCICYAIETPMLMPKFDPSKAKALKIPPKFYSILVAGNSVTLDDGTVIQPEQVLLGERKPGPVLILSYCPSLEYLDSLLSNDTWQAYTSGSKGEVLCVFHTVPMEVLKDERYADWMAKFGKDVDHIIINNEMCDMRDVHKSSKQLLEILNKIDSEVFSLPYEGTKTGNIPECITSKGLKVRAAEFLMKYQVTPIAKKGVDLSEYDSFWSEKMKYTTRRQVALSDMSFLKAEKFQSLLNTYHSHFDEKMPKELRNLSRETMEIEFLGTGAADASHVRNVTGIYVHLFEKGGIILDCGSGTYTQLFRRFGPKVDEILMNIKCVWISHKHGDHTMGIVPILARRKKLLEAANREDKLVFIAPIFIEGYVNEVSLNSGLNLTYKYYHNNVIEQPGHELTKFFQEELDMNVVLGTKAFHSMDAWGVYLLHKSGVGVLFTGDSKPCHKFPELTQLVIETAKQNKYQTPETGCTLLIHESTMCDHDSDQARKKRHSTTTQALRVAKAIDSYRMILTHFSQRQSDIPVLDFCKDELKPLLDKITQKEQDKKHNNEQKNNGKDNKKNSPQPEQHGQQKEKIFNDDEDEDDEENNGPNNNNMIPTDIERFKMRGDPTSQVDERWKTGETLDLAKVMVAFDLMRVNIVDLPKLPYILPILNYLYIYFKLYEIERLK